MARRQQGYQVAELVVVMAMLASVAAFGVPPLLSMAGDLRLRLAAAEMVGALRSARAFAVRRSANVAVKFRTATDGTVTYALYRDGNGNGVLNRDIDSGADPEVAPPKRLEQLGRGVGFGFPPGPRPRDPGSPDRLLANTGDPIRFNSSDLASFGPLGTSTPGSLYLTDGRSRLAAVRLFGTTGKVKVIVYDFAEQVWR
jgi:type II secretory pathway pseudopilin PulG